MPLHLHLGLGVHVHAGPVVHGAPAHQPRPHAVMASAPTTARPAANQTMSRAENGRVGVAVKRGQFDDLDDPPQRIWKDD